MKKKKVSEVILEKDIKGIARGYYSDPDGLVWFWNSGWRLRSPKTMLPDTEEDDAESSIMTRLDSAQANQILAQQYQGITERLIIDGKLYESGPNFGALEMKKSVRGVLKGDLEKMVYYRGCAVRVQSFDPTTNQFLLESGLHVSPKWCAPLKEIKG